MLFVLATGFGPSVILPTVSSACRACAELNTAMFDAIVDMNRGTLHSRTSHISMVGAVGSIPNFANEAAEEAYWRKWFWDQAEQVVEERFSGAGKRELKRVREYVAVNRDGAPLPKSEACIIQHTYHPARRRASATTQRGTNV
jgi:hypothetical protein